MSITVSNPYSFNIEEGSSSDSFIGIPGQSDGVFYYPGTTIVTILPDRYNKSVVGYDSTGTVPYGQITVVKNENGRDNPTKESIGAIRTLGSSYIFIVLEYVKANSINISIDDNAIMCYYFSESNNFYYYRGSISKSRAFNVNIPVTIKFL